jgi:hypothetical protein
MAALMGAGVVALAVGSLGVARAEAGGICVSHGMHRLTGREGEPPAPVASTPASLSEKELAALPPVETLTADSDICAFLRPDIPAALRNAAMRKMWMLTPAIRDHKDIAVDYAWDWNSPGAVSGDGGDALNLMRVAKTLRELSAPDPVAE